MEVGPGDEKEDAKPHFGVGAQSGLRTNRSEVSRRVTELFFCSNF